MGFGLSTASSLILIPISSASLAARERFPREGKEEVPPPAQDSWSLWQEVDTGLGLPLAPVADPSSGSQALQGRARGLHFRVTAYLGLSWSEEGFVVLQGCRKLQTGGTGVPGGNKHKKPRSKCEGASGRRTIPRENEG